MDAANFDHESVFRLLVACSTGNWLGTDFNRHSLLFAAYISPVAEWRSTVSAGHFSTSLLSGTKTMKDASQSVEEDHAMPWLT